jgi:hypothetical protein
VITSIQNLFFSLFRLSPTLLFTGLFSCFFCTAVYADRPLGMEDKLKAAYLLNFTKFIEWPDTLPSTIRICVDATPEFLQFLSQLVGDRRVGRLKSKVEVVARSASRGCELLYLQGKHTADSLQDENAIVVTDSDDNFFPDVAIVFYTENRKLRFEINREKIDASKVTVSSELLKLARIR